MLCQTELLEDSDRDQIEEHTDKAQAYCTLAGHQTELIYEILAPYNAESVHAVQSNAALKQVPKIQQFMGN